MRERADACWVINMGWLNSVQLGVIQSSSSLSAVSSYLYAFFSRQNQVMPGSSDSHTHANLPTWQSLITSWFLTHSRYPRCFVNTHRWHFHTFSILPPPPHTLLSALPITRPSLFVLPLFPFSILFPPPKCPCVHLRPHTHRHTHSTPPLLMLHSCVIVFLRYPDGIHY